MAFLKHRNERELFEIDFANRVAAGETLSAPEVQVAKPAGGTADVTTEFVETGSTVIVTTRLQFVLVVAAAGKQTAGEYDVYGRVTTSQGRKLVGIAQLTVTAEVTG